MKAANPSQQGSHSRSPRARLLFRLFLAVIYLLLLLVAGELIARFVKRPQSQFFTPPDEFSGELVGLPEPDPSPSGPFELDIEVSVDPGESVAEAGAAQVAAEGSLWEVPYYSYRPNSRLRMRRGDQVLLDTRINRFGFRDSETEIPKPAGIFRIVCVGGSTTVAGSVNHLTYPAILEKRLNTRLGTDRVEVINCGVSGMISSNELERLPDYLALEPDLILEYNGVNDIFYLAALNWRPDSWFGAIARHSALVRSLTVRRAPQPDEVQRALLEFTIRNLAAFHAQAREAGVEVVFGTFAKPMLDRLTPDQRAFFDANVREAWYPHMDFAQYSQCIDIYNAMLTALCREKQIPLIPVADHLGIAPQLFGDICHLSLAGRVRKADIMVTHLEDLVASRLEVDSRTSR